MKSKIDGTPMDQVIHSLDLDKIDIDLADVITLAALEKWGVEAQKAILQEECCELSAEIARFNRGRSDKERVAEEVADVIVCMMSVIPALDIAYIVRKYMRKKLKRLEDRLIQDEQKDW